MLIFRDLNRIAKLSLVLLATFVAGCTALPEASNGVAQGASELEMRALVEVTR